MEAVLRRVNNLHLDDQPRRVDLDVNLILHVSSQNESIGMDTIAWRGDEMTRLEGDDSLDVQSLTIMGWHGNQNLYCERSQPLDSLQGLRQQISSVRQLTIQELESGSSQVRSLFSYCDEIYPKNVVLTRVKDHDNTILEFLWNVLAKGQTKNLTLKSCCFGPELKETLSMWTQVTPDWNSCDILNPVTEEGCTLMVKLVDELYEHWLEAEEITHSNQRLQIKSPYLAQNVPATSINVEHQKVREASALISVLEDENTLTLFLFKSESYLC
uniref:Gamma-tubulin complex component n=1 Tax=Steinernema glaseri TaxID=37863 RepID=A0A1I8ABB8_9BILA